MTASSPIAPPVTHGAIVAVDLFAPIASAIVFQYNPESITRTIQPQAAGDGGGARSEALRLKGAPIETYSFEAEIDADTQQFGSAITTAMGIYPQLAALEMLAYPRATLVTANMVLAATGAIEIIPPAAPFTLLIWGNKRIVPVRMTECRIEETEFDGSLNPTKAKAHLGFRVLSYNDLGPTNPGFWVFMSHQIVKETFAAIAAVNNIASVVSGDVKLF